MWGTYQQNIQPDWIDAAGYVLCWSAKWLDEPEIIFHRLRGSHKALLHPIHRLLDEAHAVVSYNGIKFDLPTLNKEFLTHGVRPPSPYKHIDLLQTMWKVFRFPNNKLDYICKVLDLGEKLKHEGPRLWLDCMADKPKAWRKMEKYNRHDVVLLERLYHELKPWVHRHPNVAAFEEAMVCRVCGGGNLTARGTAVATQLRYRRYQCKDCGAWSRGTKSVTARAGERITAIG